jgi:hypothetical protein
LKRNNSFGGSKKRTRKKKWNTYVIYWL